MAMNERNRARAAARVEKLLGGGTPVQGFVLGHGHLRMTTAAAVTLGVFGVAFMVALALGEVIFPGVVLVWFVVRAVRPLLGVAVTHRGLAVVHISAVTGRPNRVVVLLPPLPPWPGPVTGPATVELGPEQVRFSAKELVRLAAAVDAVAPQPAAPTPAAPIHLP
jgi:hypothetical protein